MGTYSESNLRETQDACDGGQGTLLQNNRDSFEDIQRGTYLSVGYCRAQVRFGGRPSLLQGTARRSYRGTQCASQRSSKDRFLDREAHGTTCDRRSERRWVCAG